VRSLRVIVVVLAAALFAAPAALGKEGVRATLTTPFPLDAKPGTKLHVGWKLANRDGTPFGGGDVFVRLRSASGDGAETAYTHGGGTFAADVVVPEGGIGDVQIGIRGWSSGPDGTHESPMFFPITNDPLPGTAPQTSSESSTGGSNAWLVVSLIGALAALTAGAAVVVRRRHTPVRATS
jgi:MYXO-CTERM domain-containing protein